MLKLTVMSLDIIRPETHSPLRDFPSVEPSGQPQFNRQEDTPEPPKQSNKPVVSKSKRSAKPALLFLLVIILILAGAYGGYYYEHNKLKTDVLKISNLNSQVSSLNSTIAADNKKLNSSATSASATPAYPTNLVVPSTWKNYSNTQEQFSISYPTTWAYKEVPATASSSNPVSYQLEFSSAQTPSTSGTLVPGYGELETSSQSLANALSYYEKVLVTGNSSSTTSTYKVVSTTKYTFNSAPAELLITSSEVNSTKVVTYQANLLVYANSKTYSFASSSSNANPFSDNTVATVLESLKT